MKSIGQTGLHDKEDMQLPRPLRARDVCRYRD
jgi:hypothetical protein